MSTGATIAIGAVALFVLLAVFLATTSMRRDRTDAVGVLSRETRKRDRGAEPLEAVVPDTAPPLTGRELERTAVLERTGGGTVAVRPRSAPPARTGPIDPETYGQTRRQFLNRGIVGLFVVGLAGFGATMIAFLWPPPAAGFGGKITAGTVDDVKKILDTKQPFYNPQGRFYIAPFPTDQATLDKAKKVYGDGAVYSGMKAGYVALYQKCVHLGCRVPWCQTSQWFECPCHGSKYNRVGEKKGGPAPRGLDRFALSVGNGAIVVDTKTTYQGPPIGTDTTGQGQDGPHCQ
jgi:cytochrome b6-f complex iron-sulfur subunit